MLALNGCLKMAIFIKTGYVQFLYLIAYDGHSVFLTAICISDTIPILTSLIFIFQQSIVESMNSFIYLR